MPGQPGTLEIVAREVASALLPLEERLASGNVGGFIAELGLQMPGAVAGYVQVTSAAGALVVSVGALPPSLAKLAAAIEADDTGGLIQAGEEIARTIIEVIQGIADLASAISAAASAGGLSPDDRAKVEAFAQELPRRLFEYAVIEHIRSAKPAILRTLKLTGLVDDVMEPGDAADPLSAPWRRRTLHLDRLLGLFTRPGQFLGDVFGWGNDGFDGELLFQRIHAFLAQFNLPVVLIRAPGLDPVLEAMFLRFEADRASSPPGLAIRMRLPAIADFERTYRLSELWSLHLVTAARFEAGLEIGVRPPLAVSFHPPAGSVEVEIAGGLVAEKASGPMTLLGQAGGSGLFVQRIGLDLGVKTTVSSADGVKASPVASGEIAGGRLVINTAGSDGFIAKLLGNLQLQSDFGVGFAFTPEDGLRFHGSGGLEIQIPAHVQLGPIEIQAIYLRAGLSDGAVPVEMSAAFSAQLGPLQASVDRIGALVDVTFPSGGGNLGPINLGFGFKPPTGAGLAIDAGIVKGGGYLFFDPDHGEYGGALELEFADFLALKAIGLITTRMPDGSSGFSLLVIITAEFPGGLQLGYGFTLLGVGGLLGLNRTMRLDALAEGVRTGAIESVMFPHDVIANAPRIVSDLKAFFPPQAGTFLIGPMAKIGWGTPTLISIAVGIIIEIPGNIAIVGVIKVALPTEDEVILRLQVNFIGAIEFDKKRIWFFASLFESRVLTLTIDGELGLLVAYGDQPNFVLTVGGFHPAFVAPALPFPTPKRVAINILNTDNARIAVSGYFAVTSNTAQFGAAAELYFGFSAFSVQGHIGFDALFRFSPFSFIIEVSASVSLKAFGVGLFSISLRFSLEGPTPWRARGTGSISILFFEISADFDITWGEERDTTLPSAPVLPLVAAEIAKPESWRTLAPTGGKPLVSLRVLPEAERELVLHPLGTLFVVQRTVPLDIRLDKVGAQAVSDVSRCTIEVASSGLVKRSDPEDRFALAQFQNMDDAAKLSRPAFEREHAGVELGSDGEALASHRVARRSTRYEQIVIDPIIREAPTPPRLTTYNATLFNHFLRGSSVSRSPLSSAEAALRQPYAETIQVTGDAYVIASTRDNTAAGPTFSSHAQARDYLADQLADDPSLADSLHILPVMEVAA